MPFVSSVRGTVGGTGKIPRGRYNYFGDGSDGNVVISSNTSLTVPNKNGSYDGDMVVKNYYNLTINAGVTLTTDQPCRGLLIHVYNDCIINGSISMTARGPNANPTTGGSSDGSAVSSSGLRIPLLDYSGSQSLNADATLFNGAGSSAKVALDNYRSISGNGSIISLVRQGASGGGGGPSGNRIRPGGNGSNGSTGQTGGGGGGAGGYSDPSGNGGSGGSGSYGSCFGGGSGGGGGQYNGVSGSGAAAWGGIGGDGAEGGYSTYGGTGNPGGDANPGKRSNDGTGGLIILMVGGDLIINSGGSILAEGIVGGGGGGAGNAGSSGGGNIVIAYKGNYTNSGTVSVSGGAARTGNSGITGGGGGTGSIQTIHVV